MGDAADNPLLSDSIHAWDRLIESVGPASLLIAIESRLGPALRRHCTPEDILQEALLHAWRDRAHCEWRGIKAFRSWLLSIIDHRIGHMAAGLDTQKRGGSVRTFEMSAIAAGPHAPSDHGSAPWAGPAGTTTPSRMAIFREQAAAMRAALAALPDDSREVVRLRLFEQLTLEQIAERLNLSISAVRRRFGYGVEQYEATLRAALGSQLPTAASRAHAEGPNPATPGS